MNHLIEKGDKGGLGHKTRAFLIVLSALTWDIDP